MSAISGGASTHPQKALVPNRAKQVVVTGGMICYRSVVANHTPATVFGAGIFIVTVSVAGAVYTVWICRIDPTITIVIFLVGATFISGRAFGAGFWHADVVATLFAFIAAVLGAIVLIGTVA